MHVNIIKPFYWSLFESFHPSFPPIFLKISQVMKELLLYMKIQVMKESNSILFNRNGPLNLFNFFLLFTFFTFWPFSFRNCLGWLFVFWNIFNQVNELHQSIDFRQNRHWKWIFIFLNRIYVLNQCIEPFLVLFKHYNIILHHSNFLSF